MSETLDATERDADDEVLLRVQNLKKHFPVNDGFIDSVELTLDEGFPLGIDDTAVKAVDDVSFDLREGETMGIVGESGCGKSTLARTILGLEEPTDGTVEVRGLHVDELDRSEATEFRKTVQMVFQDPQSSLNPRRKVGEIIADPLEAAGWSESDRRSRALELLEDVGLERAYYDRYPHEFSGGQRQRINLARALSIEPDLVVADEPVSGLDVSVQAQILELMDDLQDEYGLTYLVISHDLSVVRHISDRLAVMYLGKFVETGPTEAIFEEQHHPYAKALLSAVPNPDPSMPGVVSTVSGNVPSATDPPEGCPFHTRCPLFIVPEGFSEAAYEAFDDLYEDLRDGEAAVEDGTEAVRSEYFGDARLPSDARSAVEAAVRAAASGESDPASELEPHRSVCQREVPPLEATGDGRAAACHLDVSDGLPALDAGGSETGSKGDSGTGTGNDSGTGGEVDAS